MIATACKSVAIVADSVLSQTDNQIGQIGIGIERRLVVCVHIGPQANMVDTNRFDEVEHPSDITAKVGDTNASRPRAQHTTAGFGNRLGQITCNEARVIRFGDAAWHGLDAHRLLDTDLTPMCAPALAKQLSDTSDLARCTLLRSFRGQDWLTWLKAAGLDHVALSGPVFDSSFLMTEAAACGHGVAILPTALFGEDIAIGRLVRPFALSVAADAYWLVTPRGREPSNALVAFSQWISREASETIQR
jgi:hypothetical protein